MRRKQEMKIIMWKLSTVAQLSFAMVATTYFSSVWFGSMAVVKEQNLHDNNKVGIYPDDEGQTLPIRSKFFDTKMIGMPSRMRYSEPYLRRFFPPLEVIPAFEKAKVDDVFMETMKVLDQKWDQSRTMWKPLGMSANRITHGEIACVLSHRRALEKFLVDSTQQYMLVLEDDAVPFDDHMIRDAVVATIKAAPKSWQLINIGRCWAKCTEARAVRTFHLKDSVRNTTSTIRLERSLGWEFCTHAILVSRTGAEILLQYSAPILLPYDLIINILARNNILEAFYTSPPLFDQSNAFSSMIKESGDASKPECNKIHNIPRAVQSIDNDILKRIITSPVQNMVNVMTRKIRDSATPEVAEVARQAVVQGLCLDGSRVFCRHNDKEWEAIRERCRIHGGNQGRRAGKPDTGVATFLRLMEQTGLRGVVIWGLRPEEQHSHAYVHSALYLNLEHALKQSSRPMHLCYVKESPGFDLGKHLYNNTNLGKLASSLVFSSPKHMTWSNDMGYLMLPVEETSMYVFHGQTPRPHDVLRRKGRALEWEAWGNDGHIPHIDAEAFIRGQVWSPGREGCRTDFSKKQITCKKQRQVVMPWASLYTAQEIREKMEEVAARKTIEFDNILKYVGSLWYCNIQTFYEFTRGCRDKGIGVVRFGKLTHDDINRLKQLPNFKNVKTTAPMEELLVNTTYAPAVQGHCHLSSPASYIADRLINLISLGIFPLTNNRDAYELLGSSDSIIFHDQAEQLCDAISHHSPDTNSLLKLMETVAREHTYLARMTTLLEFATELS